ncbi:UDP-forming cellulose synthase catalytic subunit [Limnobacter parvus]|uniref:Cellulose synthase catalytic subunit [UDP-forming] n=1 Tax=Limnobacter parvus TaxID=2939690 RepID=A0ABT1XLZ7_9BURK|nr:UDP-forming cellulose synthase catalytic subunit [Limnobacter parvus]MCR2747109.1 UDP-forming cellulose synthase catalytic subunit [Limnobacter parvus]
MSKSSNWINRLERLLDLREYPNLSGGVRLKRLFQALWLRPNSLNRALASTERTHPLKAAFRVFLVALYDLFSPVLAVFRFTIQRPLKAFQRGLGRLADRFVVAARLEQKIEYTSAFILRFKVMGWLLGLSALALFLFTAQASLPLAGQWVFIVVCYLFAMLFKRLPERFANLCLMALTMLLLARYVFWRFTSSLDLETGAEIFLGYTLVIAESYTWIILIFGFIQTAWPLKRKPMPLELNLSDWPTVDVFIPSYNEPLSVVRPTVYAAKGLDWPLEKITVYILDDGHRPAFEEFAKQAGVEYISRPDNSHAKAGNINYALKHTHGKYIAIFDCDHIPTRSFLQTCMGWFSRDPKCVLVQTPHHFFSADPFERNFNSFRQMPNEGSLFYGLIQDGNDYWNASFFCGSCAVIERKALLEVGGIAVETVTEDAHTALKLHSLGYNSVYLNNIQAAGLATETLAGHIGQRIRWARGMAQIFRTDNPMFKKGLSIFQRICYSNAMLHFFYGIPRMIFLIMPMAYLFFEQHLINAAALTILSYALPQLIISSYTNSVIQGQYRRSFWSEVYETVLSWYIILPTTLAFINPKLGKFNVTSKGGLIEKSYFDSNIAKPYLILLLINLLGFVVGLFRLFVFNTHETGTVLMNLLWCGFNLAILGAAVGVATESVQKHVHHRVRMIMPAFLKLPGGYTVSCYTEEYSAAGLTLAVADTTGIREFSEVQVGLHRGDREFLFPAKVHFTESGRVEALFTNLTPEQETQLIQCTFGRADAWLNWQEDPTRDRALGGLKDVFAKGITGYVRLFAWIKGGAVILGNRLMGNKAQNEKWEN